MTRYVLKAPARRLAATFLVFLLPSVGAAQVPASPAEGAPQEAPQGASVAYDHRAAPTAHVVRITEQITVDGRLDEPVWMTAPAITEFYQTVPDEGAPVSQPTEVRFLYDGDYLYIGGWMWDDGEIITRLARRDAGVGDTDVFAVHFDGYHDHRTAYRLATNPSGWYKEELVVGARGGQGGGGGGPTGSWDPIWETKSTITDEGWFVEIAIPFSQLRYGTGDVQTWGLQIERKIRRRGEDNVWAFIPRNQAQGVARYGHLEGLEGLAGGKRLEVLPFTTGRAEYRNIEQSPNASFENPFRSGHDYFGDLGADLKYRLGTNFTLDGAVNPDFGQVELDPAVINLSAFETRFDEKRPFFVEGADIFRFGEGRGGGDAQLLYSRRIGRAPQGSVSDDAEYADEPSSTTILGAAKITGRTATGWSLGILDGVSDRAVAPWVASDGSRSRTEIEPRTNYFAARLRRDLNEGTRGFGVIATAVNRDIGGGDLGAELRSSAYAAGVDGRLEWDDRAWVLGARVAGSRVAGSASAIARTQLSSARYFARPDAGHLSYDPQARDLSGYFATLNLDKQNGTWQGGVGLTATSPGFEVNDLGFQSAADRIDVGGEFGYQQPTTGRHFRNFSVTASAGATSNFGGEALSKDVGLQLNATHMSQNGFNARVSRRFQAWNDRQTRGGPLMVEPGGWSANASINTDQRKAVQTRLGMNYSEDDAGGWRRAGNLSFTMRLAQNYEIILGANLSRSRSPAQYVQTVADAAATSTFGNRYVFAAIDQQTLEIESRVNVTFSPTLTFELYAQPFVSSGDYLALKELAAPRTFDFVEYGRDAGTITRGSDGRYQIDPDGSGNSTFSLSDRDFDFRSLLGNAVLRWEWRPGSTLFLVWQQSRSERLSPGADDPEGAYGQFDLGTDTRDLFRIQPDNVFMLKVSYWLNP